MSAGVTISLADDEGALVAAKFCGIECAKTWLATIPAKFKKMRAELSPEKARAHGKLLAAFAAEV